MFLVYCTDAITGRRVGPVCIWLCAYKHSFLSDFFSFLFSIGMRNGMRALDSSEITWLAVDWGWCLFLYSQLLYLDAGGSFQWQSGSLHSLAKSGSHYTPVLPHTPFSLTISLPLPMFSVSFLIYLVPLLLPSDYSKYMSLFQAIILCLSAISSITKDSHS